MTLGQRVRYFFRRDDEGSIDPQMFMRKPVDGGGAVAAKLKAPTVMNRGGTRYVSPAGTASRQVTVRTWIRGGDKAKAHAQYLMSKDAGLDGEKVRGFDAKRDDIDLKAMTAEWENDRHHLQVTVSPQDGAKLDLMKYTRDVVATWERDLGTGLAWGAVIHYDTEHPHVHLMIRGRDDRGGDLVIGRSYISHGMRYRAMDVATQELGHRPAHEIAADLEKRRLEREAGLERPVGLGRGGGWQIHLNVSAKRWDPTTQAIMAELKERGLHYRMDFGAKDTKTLTVSVGSHDDAVRVARELDAKYGDRIPDHVGKVVRDDVRLSGHVWGAFHAQGDREFTRWTVKGLPLDRDAAKELRGMEGAAREALRDDLRTAADAKLMERYGEFYAGSERVQALEKLQELQRSMGHGHGH